MPPELHASSVGALDLLKGMYPTGIDEADYLPLLAVLYEHFSDRNLANLISNLTPKDSDVVLNDIYAAVSTKRPSPSAIEQVTKKLEKLCFSLKNTDD
ncbi:DUF3349 domain-containing protein [Pseudomonas purpurea]|uniref:DUF3349 domain-containing protein n=1 Tax=Pseudomonas purpurea TaxID=3136737 RepID=UPI00326436C0